MLEICVYIGEDYVGSIESPVVPRKSESMLYKGKCYTIKDVIYSTKKTGNLMPRVSTIGIELGGVIESRRNDL
ncbi:hypothetical protein G9F71_008685 [Clostridium sp. FP2]|uniref:hypothetical protein n=1 Tax=Clostridium sp. FP2 TaxID=2724481 RepID=UPI0013E983C0|nr:hypothetical protein [Clostridium sp. FP2]MBZ9622929.1 hypothetical protein [Clostridium sp. FP2]